VHGAPTGTSSWLSGPNPRYLHQWGPSVGSRSFSTTGAGGSSSRDSMSC